MSILVSAFLLYTLRDNTLQTTLFPTILLIVFVALGIALIFSKGKETYSFGKFRTVLLVYIIFALYIMALPYLGFIISTALFIGLFLVLTKYKTSILGFVLIPIAVSLSIWFVFAFLFKVSLPEILF
ncbi:MAG: tripartite tricarboxylate transporter TctB family protein [Spirochaetales bacterium]